ncbi:MAG: hypothetical protein QXH91_05475, partial [Candidatus Bathyarchaeia archaeon]
VRASKGAAIMYYVLTDNAIEKPEVIKAQLKKLASAGFAGVLCAIRASRYGLEDHLVIQAVKEASQICHNHRMEFWFLLDPRLPSRYNNQHFGKGLEIVTCADAVWPKTSSNIQPIHEGRFNVRFHIEPRQTWTLQDVAITYIPRGLERVFAFPRSLTEYASEQIIDITDQTRFFFNARDNYVEAFGSFDPPHNKSWSVLTFFRFETNYFDYSDPKHFSHYSKLVKLYADSGVELDRLIWDEPGYWCLFGIYPFSSSISNHLRETSNFDLSENLWKLALPAKDRSHIYVRNSYFYHLQTTVIERQKETIRLGRQLWGKHLRSGIHHTWHFESADMADMNHGSIDPVRSLESVEAGFTDTIPINELREPDSPFYVNLAAMFVLTQSLAKFSISKEGYVNLWTSGHDDGSGFQNELMNHCVNLMLLFSVKWLAHCYGPVGLIGQEDTYLGSKYLPGYPDHSTWQDFPIWNKRLAKFERHGSRKLPTSNILVVFPVETICAIGNALANPIARDVFDLVLKLLDHHYLLDFISPTLLKHATFENGIFKLNEQKYMAVIYPHPRVLSASLLPLLESGRQKVFYGFQMPQWDTIGSTLNLEVQNYFTDSAQLLKMLALHKELRPVKAPQDTWISLIEDNDKHSVTLCSARANKTYSGMVTFREWSCDIGVRKGLTKVIFYDDAEPKIVFATEK